MKLCFWISGSSVSLSVVTSEIFAGFVLLDWVSSLITSVFWIPLVCLSIDVTGALVFHPHLLTCLWFARFVCTCVSVHRRDRCTCTLPAQLRSCFHFSVHATSTAQLVFCISFLTKVKKHYTKPFWRFYLKRSTFWLVYLTIDVTGSLNYPPILVPFIQFWA